MGRLASARWAGRSPLGVPRLGLGQSALAGRVPSLSHLAGLLLPGWAAAGAWAAPLRTWAVRATAARWAAGRAPLGRPASTRGLAAQPPRPPVALANWAGLVPPVSPGPIGACWSLGFLEQVANLVPE